MLESATRQLTLWSSEDAVDNWNVRESARARRLTVRVFRSGRVEVVVPRRTSQRRIAAFLDQHREWIERKREEARRNVSIQQPFPPQSIELAACDEIWRIHMAGGVGRTQIDTLAPGLLGLTGNVSDERTARQALRRWLASKAYEVLSPWLARIAQELGFIYSKVIIRMQRSRWGSCSVRGTISLNCTLLFQRPEVVGYLLIHELVHTWHMNHSRRFWNCVAKCCPDYRELDKELREGWKRVPEWVFDR